MVKKKGKKISVSFCPRCKSRDVGYVFGLGNLFGVLPKMRCRKCGFESSIFPVLSISEEELKEAVGGIKKKKKKVISKTKRKVVKK